jgi:hypothetical protein
MDTPHHDTITRYEWHGNAFFFALLFLSGIFTPYAAVYFIKNIVALETRVPDAEAFAAFLSKKDLSRK